MMELSWTARVALATTRCATVGNGGLAYGQYKEVAPPAGDDTAAVSDTMSTSVRFRAHVKDVPS